MQSLRKHVSRPGVSESEIQRAILGKNISEKIRSSLERMFLSPLRFADREPDNRFPSGDSAFREPADLYPVTSFPDPRDSLDAEIAYQTAEQFYLRSDFQRALAWFLRAYELYKDTELDQLHVALTNVKIASCYSFLDQTLDAMRLLENSVGVLQRTREKAYLADAHEGLGVVKLTRGDIDAAQYHYQRAFEAAENSSSVVAGNAQFGLARVKMARVQIDNHDDRKDSSLQVAVTLYVSGESRLGRANCCLARGIMSIMRCNLVNAIEWLKCACGLYEEARNGLGHAVCHEILGDLCARGGMQDEAIEHRGRAWALFPRTGSAGYDESLKDRMRLEHMLIRTGYSRLFLTH